jgi:DNA-binding NtrC family response regulator
MVSDSLARNGGSITAAANELGISRTVICELIAKLGIAAA